MKKLLTGISVVTIIALGLTDLSAQQRERQGGWAQGGDRGARIEQIFKNLDANGDGKISGDEFKGPAEGFEKMDTDQDGALTLEEMKKGMAQRMRQRQKMGQGEQGQRGAREQGQRKAPLLQQADTNKDGTISKAEWAAAFSKMDADGNGKLSTKELMGAGQKKKERANKDRTKAMDTDGDGKISKAEFLEKTVNQMFTRLDKDGDGFVTADEAEAARPKAQKERPGQQAKAGQKAQQRPPKTLVERFDTDGDGKLSKAELAANFTKHFVRLDKNGDGYITDDEKPQWGQGARKQGARKQDARKQGANTQKFKEMFNRFDKDGDGMLSVDEAPKRLKERFTKLDGNDDGFLSQEELTAAGGGKAPGQKATPQYLTDNDTDGNGKLSIEEFSGSKTNFDAIDTNGDGFITAKELNKARMRK